VTGLKENLLEVRLLEAAAVGIRYWLSAPCLANEFWIALVTATRGNDRCRALLID
jgi:hypothetical protein